MNHFEFYYLLLSSVAFFCYSYGKSKGRCEGIISHKVSLPKTENLADDLVDSALFIKKRHEDAVGNTKYDAGQVVGHALLVYMEHENGRAWFWQTNGKLSEDFLLSAPDAIREAAMEMRPTRAPKPTVLDFPERVQ